MWPSRRSRRDPRQVGRPQGGGPHAAPDPFPQGGTFLFKHGDRLLFHGDSITQQNLYTLYVETFLLTRFPEACLQFYNAGWKAHRADEGLARFDRDVAAHRPQWVTLLFGANDAMAKPFTAEHQERFRTATLALLERTATIGARPILITPPVVDMDQPPPRPMRNAILEQLSEEAAAIAARTGVPFVDLFHPMKQMQERAKAADPSFTFLPDGVHPNPVGHLCIAFLILDQLGLLPSGPGLALPTGCLEATVPARIPFSVESEAQGACDLLPVQEQMAAWRLSAPNLPFGHYRVWLDGVPAGEFSAEALASGADLSAAAPPELRGRSGELLQLGRERFRYQYNGWREYGNAAERPDPELAAAYAPLLAATEEARQLAARRRPIHVRLEPLGQQQAQ